MRALGGSLIRLRALLGKEYRQLLRDPRLRFTMLVPPLFQLVVFGYAATFDVRRADIALVDQANTQTTRDLLAAVTATSHFTAWRYPDMPSATAAMDRGRVRAILRFAPDFGRQPVAQIVTDGADSNSAQMIVGELSQAIQRRTRQAAGRRPLIEVEERAWFNENLDDRLYFVPGIIANILLVTTSVLIAMAVVRERELGTLERLMVTPVARLEFLLGKIAAVATVGLFQVLLVTTIAVAWFGVPFRGSYPALLVGVSLFLLSTLGIGLLISSYAATQQQAMLLGFFIIMPMVMLSGFAFPISNMPESIQWFTGLDPLRYFLVVIRDLFLKGGGLTEHLFEYGMMGLLGSAALLLSLLRLR